MADPFHADIIIVGAGTAGLVLAHGLSNDPKLRIHVIEAGKDCTDHPDTKNVSNYIANLGSDRDWQFDSVPQAGFNGRTAMQNSGKLFGGSSSINGGYYVAPSRAGVNAWAELGNPHWGYGLMREACLETIQIHTPDRGVCAELGLDESPSVVGRAAEPGRVQVTGVVEEHPITKAYFSALRDLGYPTTSAIFNERSAFGQTLNFTQDPSTSTRSDANTAFGQALKERPNVKISLETTVKRVILEGAPPNVSARGVEVIGADGESSTFFASFEVILSAGSLSTPKILELSGIGQSELLQRHQIPVVVENAYVGERLRNHVMAFVHCELSHEVAATTPGLKAMSYMSSKDQPGLIEALREYTGHTDDQYYDTEVKRIFLDPEESSCCHFMGHMVPNMVTFGVISAIPFSQGRTHITSSEVGDQPTVDPCFFSHPLDLEVMSRHLRTAANFAAQPAMKPFFKMDADGVPVGTIAAMSTDLDKIKNYIRESSITTYHACGTASMRPREEGGVVDQDFKVYDTDNLHIVDASVIPLLAHGNPMAAVYGIAKLAAEIIGEKVETTLTRLESENQTWPSTAPIPLPPEYANIVRLHYGDRFSGWTWS